MRIITRKITVFILLYISTLLFFSSCEKFGNDSEIVVFKDANVISMCNDSILMGHSVLIEGNKIIDVGIFEEMEIPKAAQIIDGKDQYLIPGLCDMHVHLTDDDDRILYIANGVTLIRNMAGLPYHLNVRENINKKFLIGPEIYTTGLIVDGENPSCPQSSIVIKDKEKVSEALSQMKNDGYDAIKVYENLTKEVYNEVIRVAKKLEIPVVGHVPRTLDLKDVLFSGQTSIEHLDGYEKYYSDEQIIAETVNSGIWNCPTLLIFKNYGNLYHLQKFPPSEIKYVHPETLKYWNDRHQTDMGFVKKMELLHSLTNNKANIVSGTDAGTPFVVAGFSLHKELSLRQDAGLTPNQIHLSATKNWTEMLGSESRLGTIEKEKDAGLTTYQILLSATRNCAEMLGYASRLGTIEKEKDADLVLLKNNPLKDIRNTKSIVGVMSKGSWYTKEDLDSMLEKVAAKKNSLMHKSTIHNSIFLKLIVFLLTLTFASTFLIRPILYVFNKNTLKSQIRIDNGHSKKYCIRFFIISVSIISLTILLLIAMLPEPVIQYGLPTILADVPVLLRYKLLLPFVNLIFSIALLILYTIAFLRNNLSSYQKWHTLSIIFCINNLVSIN